MGHEGCNWNCHWKHKLLKGSCFKHNSKGFGALILKQLGLLYDSCQKQPLNQTTFLILLPRGNAIRTSPRPSVRNSLSLAVIFCICRPPAKLTYSIFILQIVNWNQNPAATATAPCWIHFFNFPWERAPAPPAGAEGGQVLISRPTEERSYMCEVEQAGLCWTVV